MNRCSAIKGSEIMKQMKLDENRLNEQLRRHQEFSDNETNEARENRLNEQLKRQQGFRDNETNEAR